MVLVCDQCQQRVGLVRRIELCPFCGKKTTWTEPLTANDRRFLQRMRIVVEDEPA